MGGGCLGWRKAFYGVNWIPRIQTTMVPNIWLILMITYVAALTEVHSFSVSRGWENHALCLDQVYLPS